MSPATADAGQRTRALVDGLARSPVETTAWTDAFREAYAATHVVRTVTVRRDGIPQAQATLSQALSGPARLELPHLWEPGDLVHRDRAALDDLARALVQLRVPLRLSRLPRASATPAALAAAASRARGWLLQHETTGWPGVRLDTGTDPERLLNAGRRSDLRRSRRRADRLGELSFEVLRPGPDALPGLLEEAWRVEASSWKLAAGTALAVDTQRGPFYARYLRLAAEAGTTRVAFARLSGRAVATQLATVVDGRLWLHKIGFDQAYGTCSPGQLLMLEVLRSAAQEGLASVELMGTPEPWTRMWTTHVRPCVSLRWFPPSTASLPALAEELQEWWRAGST